MAGKLVNIEVGSDLVRDLANGASARKQLIKSFRLLRMEIFGNARRELQNVDEKVNIMLLLSKLFNQ